MIWSDSYFRIKKQYLTNMEAYLGLEYSTKVFIDEKIKFAQWSQPKIVCVSKISDYIYSYGIAPHVPVVTKLIYKYH